MRKKSEIFRIVFLTLFLMFTLIALGGLSAQSGVTAVVVNDWANIRIVPAIGAEVISTVPSGYFLEFINARSGDNQWLRIDFNGSEGWVHMATITVLTGDINSLPVADPRSIPYGGFEAPRSGITSATSDKVATLLNGLHVRAGPSTGYPILAEAPINSVVALLGRTANSAWVQINFEGTLGWIATRYLELSYGTVLSDLPIDGVIADGPVIGDPTGEDYLETLRLMLARVDLAQPTLDWVRSYWTDAALNHRAHCDEYPARPSNYNIPNALLASHYTQLDPLSRLFNDAMTNLRLALDAFIEVCNQPGTANPVSQPVAIQALDIVALVDSQFAKLRRRINELLPPPVTIGIGECLFTFAGETTILPVIPIGEVFTDDFTPKKWVTGYCFDALQGQSLIFETLQLGSSNIIQLLAVSPIDNPTNFTITGQANEGIPELVVGPVVMPATARYLLILFHTGDIAPQGQFGFLIHEPYPGVPGIRVLQVDPVTGAPVIALSTSPTLCPNVAFSCQQLTSCNAAYACLNAGNFSLDIDGNGIPCEQNLCGPAAQPTPITGTCPNLSATCDQLVTCADAYACLAAGNYALDPDNDGVPCESIKCPASP